MAETPVSALSKLRRFQVLIEADIAIFLMALLYLAYRQLQIGWVALPLAVWAGILLLRPNLPDVKRVVLFWIGTALVITIMVELVAVRGDIGRMNTIFKFYLQAWLLLAVSIRSCFRVDAAGTLSMESGLAKLFPGWNLFVISGRFRILH